MPADGTSRELPARPSKEHLRKQAKRLARDRSLGLARLALDAGADVNAFLPVHRHSTPLHQAALDENLELMEFLVARGARADVADKLWGSTPLGWAIHRGKSRSRAYLERLQGQK